jgi:hypothetical protein
LLERTQPGRALEFALRRAASQPFRTGPHAQQATPTWTSVANGTLVL